MVFRSIFCLEPQATPKATQERLKKIITAPNLEADVTLLSATFSDLLLDVYESRLVIEKCNNAEAKRSWVKLFTHFMDDEQLFSTFSPLRLRRPGRREPIESQSAILIFESNILKP